MHGKWSHSNFLAHHEANPEIYRLFKEYAVKVAKYRPKYSAKAIFHVIRWDTMLAEVESEYKIDDGWISHYARLFVEENPKYEGLFETRVRQDTYHK